MTDTQPDIEIYLKRPLIEDVVAWLSEHFEVTETHSTGDQHRLTLRYQGEPLTCMVFEKVAKGGYASIWFKSNNTPWATDEECASAAFDRLGIETRCSTGGWEADTEDDRGGWYRFTANGKSKVNWLT